MKKAMAGGYFTLEAALIMPVVLFCVQLIIYVSIWEYNQSISIQTADKAIVTFNEMDGTDDIQERDLYNKLNGGEYKFMLRNIESKVNVSGNTVQIRIDGEVETPFVQEGFTSAFHCGTQKKYERVDAVKYIWMYKRIMGE